MSDVHDYPRCSRCGHQPGYHGATFCNIMAGTPPGRPCDCPGWHVGSENEAAAGYGAQVAVLRDALDRTRRAVRNGWPHEQREMVAPVYEALIHADAVLDSTASAAAGYGPLEPLRVALKQSVGEWNLGRSGDAYNTLARAINRVLSEPDTVTDKES